MREHAYEIPSHAIAAHWVAKATRCRVCDTVLRPNAGVERYDVARQEYRVTCWPCERRG